MVMCAMFGGIMGALLIWAIPGENEDIVVYMVGHVSGLMESCVMYWVGSTKASENKDTLIQGYKGKPLNRGVFYHQCFRPTLITARSALRQ